jgi:phenylacetate-coenzyme A ligase PaaK-like adenylate-forming protein
MNDARLALEETITEYLRRDPFSVASIEKNVEFLNILNQITKHHLTNCEPYKRIVDPIFGTTPATILEEIPYIPVQLFKTINLISIPIENIAKTMTSSGTTGQLVSKIVLDKATSGAQTRALAQIMKSVLGPTRVPMLIIDSSEVVRNRNMFSARGAGIRGFSMFGKDVEYALDDNMKLRTQEIVQFLDCHQNETIFLFGFTYMIWQHFCDELSRNQTTFSIPNGILLHGGGWKKLASLNIGNKEFRDEVKRLTGIATVMNYYGMVEQTGSIFIECAEGHLHTSAYSDVIVRDIHNFEPLPVGQDGVIQVISMLPLSYPGHSLLTEDMGVILGHDDCVCGRPGTRFRVHGRMKDAEIRGCSDTYAT